MPGQDGDLELARRCAAGDPEAISDLVDAHGAFLIRLCGRVHPSGGEDAAAEVFLCLLEGQGVLLRAYRGESSLKAYLGAVARRIAADARKREARRMLTPLPAEGPEAPSDQGETGILDALSRLPKRDREVLGLRYLEGLPFRELARRLGVPVGTAACWTARARERLKSQFPE